MGGTNAIGTVVVKELKKILMFMLWIRKCDNDQYTWVKPEENDMERMVIAVTWRMRTNKIFGAQF